MRLRELIRWPPSLAGWGSTSAPSTIPDDGLFESCVIVDENPPHALYLALMIRIEKCTFIGIVSGHDESTLRQVHATLVSHEDQSVAELSELEVVESG